MAKKEPTLTEGLLALRETLGEAIASGEYAGVVQSQLVVILGAIDALPDALWSNKVVGN